MATKHEPLGDLKGLLKEVLQTKLYYLTCTGYFGSTSAFSDVYLPLTSSFKRKKRFIKLAALLQKEEAIAAKFSKCEDAVRKMCCKEWSVSTSSEESSVIEIARLLEPLCSKVVLEPKPAYVDSGFETKAIGIGTFDTWHGSPDLRICAEPEERNCINMIYEGDDHDDQESEEEAEADSGDINVEVKKNMNSAAKKVRGQVAAMTVATSFTNRLLFDESVTPVLLVCKKRVRVCLFDCRLDILLFSSDVALASSIDEMGEVDPRGIILIWIILHFRDCFKGIPTGTSNVSMINQRLTEMNTIKHFHGLEDTNVNWKSEGRAAISDDELGEVEEVPPPLKRARTK